MRKFKEAEEMHIKAIQIKEQLGQEDYEVALSVGHLASLYNYDMNQYENAEKLYLRSIAIGKKLLVKATVDWNTITEVSLNFTTPLEIMRKCLSITMFCLTGTGYEIGSIP